MSMIIFFIMVMIILLKISLYNFVVKVMIMIIFLVMVMIILLKISLYNFVLLLT